MRQHQIQVAGLRVGITALKAPAAGLFSCVNKNPTALSLLVAYPDAEDTENTNDTTPYRGVWYC